MRATIVVLCVLLVPALGTYAVAGTLPTGLSVTGEVSLDSKNQVVKGDASMSGLVGVVEGGVSKNTTFTNSSINGLNPRSATFTDFGDGFNLMGEGSALFDNSAQDALFGLIADFSFDVENTTASAMTVWFAVDYSNSVFTSGDVAVADSPFTITGPGGTLFDASVTSTTILGDGLVTDAGTTKFSVLVPALSTVTLTGVWNPIGGAGDPGGYGRLEFFQGSVRNPLPNTIKLFDPQAPRVVPLPGAAWMGLALMGAALALRIRRRR